MKNVSPAGALAIGYALLGCALLAMVTALLLENTAPVRWMFDTRPGITIYVLLTSGLMLAALVPLIRAVIATDGGRRILGLLGVAVVIGYHVIWLRGRW